MNKKTAPILPLKRLRPSFPEVRSDAVAQIGAIVRVEADGAIWIAMPGNQTAIPARLAAVVDMAQLKAAAQTRQGVVLVFEDGDRNKPIVIGLIAPPPLAPAARTNGPSIEADVDGRRMKVTAQDEIVLECGQASITLRRNGRVLIRGTHIESDSHGTNRIKGGQVRIN